MIKSIKKFIELSKWFNRKSQHYILGNWVIYESDWNYDTGTWDWRVLKYRLGYPRAYIKFMWLSRNEYLKEEL